MSSHHYQPVIVIGAARSGTKLLRDTISRDPNIDCVPYDVSYIWRLGNEKSPDDELTLEQLTPSIRRKILRQIDAFSTGKPFLIEKTVGNCLRVPFVREVFPQAKFIHLIRDGRDVVESAFRQWVARPDWRYIFQKARTFPLALAPGYAMSYAFKTAYRSLTRGTKKVSSWGPVYHGLSEDLGQRSTLEVCARQWAVSVERSREGLRTVPQNQVFEVRYETFVASPLVVIEAIMHHIGAKPSGCKSQGYEHISLENQGKGLRNLTSSQQESVLSIIEPMLIELGYI